MVIFNSYVKLPEGTYDIQAGSLQLIDMITVHWMPSDPVTHQNCNLWFPFFLLGFHQSRALDAIGRSPAVAWPSVTYQCVVAPFCQVTLEAQCPANLKSDSMRVSFFYVLCHVQVTPDLWTFVDYAAMP